MKHTKTLQPQLVRSSPKDVAMKRVPLLLYGSANGIPVVNFTYFIEESYRERGRDVSTEDGYDRIEYINAFVSDFSTIMESIMDVYDIGEDEVIFRNENGEWLVNAKMDMLVISYFNKDVAVQAFDYLRDIYLNLFAIDDELLYQMCATHIPNEVLGTIMKAREEEQ